MPRTPLVLVTGFEPFGGSPLNPSTVVAERLGSERLHGAELRTAVLPVVGGHGPGSARAALDALLDEFPADAAIHFGEAHVRGEVSIERVAVNLRDYRIADNAGGTVQDEPVVPGAPAAHFATLPVRAIVEAVRAAGVPSGLSLSAGTYLCNEVMFHSLERGARGRSPRISGFVHVPQLEAQFAARPVAAAPISERALLVAARAALLATIAHLATVGPSTHGAGNIRA